MWVPQRASTASTRGRSIAGSSRVQSAKPNRSGISTGTQLLATASEARAPTSNPIPGLTILPPTGGSKPSSWIVTGSGKSAASTPVTGPSTVRSVAGSSTAIAPAGLPYSSLTPYALATLKTFGAASSLSATTAGLPYSGTAVAPPSASPPYSGVVIPISRPLMARPSTSGLVPGSSNPFTVLDTLAPQLREPVETPTTLTVVSGPLRNEETQIEVDKSTEPEGISKPSTTAFMDIA